MRAAVIVAPRSIDVRDAAVNELGCEDVRVRLEGSGVCASNLPVWQGRPWFTYPQAPGAPGHEAWGTVDAVGALVTRVTPGDRVALLSSHAYADYDVANAGAVVRLPQELGDAEFPGEPLACAANVFARSRILPGMRVAIVGAGFLGALVTRLAAHAGADVVAFSRRAWARDVAAAMGAKTTVPFDSVRDATEAAKPLAPSGFDCVVEAVGTQEALDLASALPGVRGRLVIAGYHQDGLRTIDMQSWNWRGLDVINAHERDPETYVSGMHSAIEMVRDGVLDPQPLFTHRVRLDELGDAFDLLDSRPDGFMKALVMM